MIAHARSDHHRVVVAGMGAVTPVGNSVPDVRRALLAGASGAARITRFDPTGFDTTFACELKGFDARAAMERALALAGIAPEDVDTINVHGTSTPLGDVAESPAIRAVFGAHADRLTATSTKSMTGHLLGAAAIEAIASVLAITDGVVPPTIHHVEPDPDCDLRHAFDAPAHRPVRVALGNAFGSGGHNACAVFAAHDGDDARRTARSAA